MKAKIFEMFLIGYKITYLKFKKKKEYMLIYVCLSRVFLHN